MNKVNWDGIEDAPQYDSPIPGAYIARITAVTDMEDKQYLKVEWDFSEGKYKDHYKDLFDAKGFWAGVLIRSYKEKALSYFKSFKTALEASNRNYVFDEDNLNGMVGKVIGIVLGEEEYKKKTGDISKRLYVAQTHSISAIQKGNFKIPELKRMENVLPETGSYHTAGRPVNVSGSDFSDFGGSPDDGPLPF